MVFTRNVRKDIDYVNGMDGTVVAYYKKTKAVEVLTQTKFRVMVWPWTDVERGNTTYYPLKAGYADTILKFQGAELPHVTVVLDAKGVPGAAYIALSRVSYGTDYLLGGVVEAPRFSLVFPRIPRPKGTPRVYRFATCSLDFPKVSRPRDISRFSLKFSMDFQA